MSSNLIPAVAPINIGVYSFYTAGTFELINSKIGAKYVEISSGYLVLTPGLVFNY